MRKGNAKSQRDDKPQIPTHEMREQFVALDKGYVACPLQFDCTDEQLAKEIKRLVHHVADFMNEANRRGIRVNFNINQGPECFVPQVTVEKVRRL